MQRRTGKREAHISPLLSRPPSSGMGSDNDKSRLSQRSLGVTNRIWLIIGLFLFLLTLTHYIVPTTPTPTYTFSNLNLTPRNYLNGSEAAPNPFDFCPAYGPGDEIGLKHGAVTLGKTRLHLGSGARIQRVLNKALTGQPVTISILGGSGECFYYFRGKDVGRFATLGELFRATFEAQGSTLSPTGLLRIARCLRRVLPAAYSVFLHATVPVTTRYLPNATLRVSSSGGTPFSPHPASELTNGAMRRTNSEYFAFCSTHHIPDSTDLVIVELDVDDRATQETQENFEILIRSILIRPDEPAVLVLGHFSPEIHTAYGYSGPDSIHNTVAQFYDVPHISIKPMVYHDYMRDPDSIAKLYADAVLASPAGHELISEALIAYMQSQICTAWAVATGVSFDAVPLRTSFDPPAGEGHGLFGGIGQRKGVPEPDGKDAGAAAEDVKLAHAPSSSNPAHPALNVPRTRIASRPGNNRRFEEIAPFCVSANDLINPLPPSLFYGSGWDAFHPNMGSSSLNTKAHYFHSMLPTSKLRVPIVVGAGDVAIYYLKEPVSSVGEGSAVECWVDDNYAGARTIENAADVGESTAALYYIDHYVSRGSHFVECQLMGEEGKGVPLFKIIGVFST
ncbi:CAP64-like protein [Mycena sanguinolenta]|uniref:CAP64-like protein n=1 Tax=Mycena sanguinolenta TaxID=230812 RepID=A0A8H7DC73_9AGAR|nr:CAP64-like protein [Mycena sanguinolenta]